MLDGNVPSQSRSGRARATQIAVLVLAGTIAAALLFGWAVFLFWLIVKGLMAVVNWL